MPEEKQNNKNPGITANWSGSYLQPNAENKGSLSIYCSGGSLTIKKGDMVELDVFYDSGWRFEINDPDWKSSNDGEYTFYLTYQGQNDLDIPTVSLFEKKISVATESAQPIEIPLCITPQSEAKAKNITVTVLDANKNSLSNQFRMPTNYIEPDKPLSAYALSPAAAILGKSGVCEFKNSIACVLHNNGHDASKLDSLMLSLKAGDNDQNLKDCNVTSNNISWTPSGDGMNWTASIDPDFSITEDYQIQIDNLVLNDSHDSSICTLEVVFHIHIGDQDYNTTARFGVYGPYTINLSFTDGDQNAQYFILQSDPKGESDYYLFSLNPEKWTPPLKPQLVDPSGQTASPPMQGSFQWTTIENSYRPLGSSLSKGKNTLCYVDKRNESITERDVTMEICTEIYAIKYYQLNKGAQAPESTQTEPEANYGEVMPAGAIIMWAGTIEDIPKGWALCDKVNHSKNPKIPDLTNRFIMGAGAIDDQNSVPTGQSGDADTHTHNFTANNQPLSISSVNDHWHTIKTRWYASLLVGPNDKHNKNHASAGENKTMRSGIDTDNDPKPGTFQSQGGGGHTHTGSANVSGTTVTNSGGIRPPWFTLAFIIKL